ncbi:MAG TPA: hypothetical protein VF715_11170 [Thermoleophilaceae bacterium]
MGRLVATALVLLTALGAADASRAAWQSPGTGGQFARAVTLGSGAQPSGSVTGRSVSLSWSATTLPGGASVSGYTIRRYSTGGTLQSIGSGCSGTVSATSCTEASVPPGTWRYTAQPRHGNWAGGEGAQSAAVTVAGPSVSIVSGSPAASLPATVTAALSGYAPGQTLTYRLDDASTGTLLTGGTAPSPIPATGAATATVTIPAGTAGGSHTLYAIGSAGDVASAAIAVDSTVTTGAWRISDASGGSAADLSAEPAFGGDSRVAPTGRWTSAFSATRYLDLDFADPLPDGQAVTGASFAFRYAAEAAGQTACFYFEVRRVSTGAVLGTHGSAASPAGCVTGTGMQTFTTGTPAITTSDLAGDARVRVYVSQSASRSIDVDLATLGGSAALTPFTLHVRDWTDAADGSPDTSPLPLAAEDGTAYGTSANWPQTFAATQFLEVGFPAYVPAGATVRSAGFRHVWRPSRSGNTGCWYFEVYAGATLIGTHGSAAAPVSCSSSAAYVSDTVALPEVDTPARANALTIRIYARVTGAANRRTDHDATELSVVYGQ